MMKIELLTVQKNEIDSLWESILKSQKNAEIITASLGYPDVQSLLEKVKSIPVYLLKKNRNIILSIMQNVVMKNIQGEDPVFPKSLVEDIKFMFDEADPKHIEYALSCISMVPVYKAPVEWNPGTVVYRNMCYIHNVISDLYSYCDESDYPYIFKCRELTGKSIYEHIVGHDIDTVVGLMSYIYNYCKDCVKYSESDEESRENSERAYNILVDMLSNDRPYVLPKDFDLYTALPSDEELEKVLKN